MSDKFCIMPFRHQMIEPSGSVKVCCMVDGSVEIADQPASVQEFPLDTIWRSEHMRKLRGEMLAGNAPAICHRCYDYEALGGTSYRMMSNALYRETGNTPLTAAAFAALPLDTDLVDGKPDFFQLVLGNFCNLKCRMCNATFSSSIENDPVHSSWLPRTNPVVPNWRQDSISVGPQPTLMVKRLGFGTTEWRDGQPLCWTTGEAVLSLPWRQGWPAELLEVEIWGEAARDTDVTLSVNGTERSFTLTDIETSCLRVPLSAVELGSEVSIVLRSRASAGVEGQSHGLPLKDIRLFRAPSRTRKGRVAFAGRFSGDRPWYEQNSLLFAELLADPARLRKLQITGGEPFLLPQMEEMLEYLIDTSVAGNIVLNISSNCTTLTDAHLEKLARFRRVELCLSIEGVEEDQEYIRYPSKWAEIGANVERFKTLANASLQVNPTVQIYNFMRLDRLIQWCDRSGLTFYAQRLVDPPHLSIAVAPQSARELASRRIRAAAENLTIAPNRQNAMALAQILEDAEPSTDRGLVENFMCFTNDLDRSRGQSFIATHAELYEHFRTAGIAWSDQTAFLRKARI